MKKIILLASALVLISPVFKSQTKQERSVSHFTAVNVSSAIKAIITVSDKESMVFEAEDKLLPKLKAEVSHGVLYIECSKSDCDSKKETVAYISVKELHGIVAEGASSVRTTNLVKTDHLNVSASGASSLDLTVEAGELKATGKGASTISVKGQSKSLWMDMEGASTFKGGACTAIDAHADAKGASTAKVNAVKSLQANASGASTIIYSGTATDVKTDAQDASTIKKG